MLDPSILDNLAECKVLPSRDIEEKLDEIDGYMHEIDINV